MKRRSFIKNSAATGALLSINACTQEPKSGAAVQPIPDNFDLNEITISDLKKGFKNGVFSIKQVVQLYLNRIDEIDKNGPSLNSVIEINPDAAALANTMDEELKEGKTRGSLHGIPVMVKDNINTISGQMMTTAGSLALKGNIASENAWVAEKLEEAGAIIIGKTNLSEWANFRSTRSSSGWSGRGGQTHNPYITDRNPCGSSSGSGVAVSANLCTAALGTETDGSIVCPSSTNGVVGIKPTLGLVSRAGIIPIAHSHDTAGPMCRTVEDAAIMLGVLTGIDKNDTYTQRSKGRYFTDYTQFLNKEAIKGKTLGVARRFFGFHNKVDALMEAAINDLKKLGATIVDLDNNDLDDNSGDDAYEVLLYEFKHDLNRYLQKCSSDIQVRFLEELIEFNKTHANDEMPYFGQEIFLEAQKRGDLDSESYKKALAKELTANRNGIDRIIKKHGLNAIISPTGGPAWPIDVINGDHFMGGSSSPAARAGYPNITVPMGFVHGLPVGISFFAGAFSEPTLIGIGYAYEQAAKHRKAPTFLPTFKY